MGGQALHFWEGVLEADIYKRYCIKKAWDGTEHSYLDGWKRAWEWIDGWVEI